MEAVVDGIIFETNPYGGVARIYSEIIPLMCSIDPSLRVMLLTSNRSGVDLPAHSHIYHRSFPPIEYLLHPRRLFWLARRQTRALIQQSILRNSLDSIWHSTYYTMPKHWQGPIVVTVYDMIHEYFASLFPGFHNDQFRRHKQQCVTAADAVICISKATRQHVGQVYNVNDAKLYVVQLAYNPIFKVLDEVNLPKELLVKRPYFLYVGRRTHYKNFDGLLRAYSRWEGRDAIDLVVVGPNWLKNERQYLAELDIVDRVHLIRNVDDQLLCVLYNQAKAFIYPSLYEGFGIPVLEAMACACPVIASHIPSTVEVAGKCPIYFEPTEMESLVTAFNVAISEGHESERTNSGLKKVKDFSWEITAEQTLTVYRSLS